ncbi:MAG TPA: tetratricopeptide repeat protein [Azospirillum sp.]|nr:tetratricopeptide repeat protein [Azospirillum sp.]
MSDIFQEVDEDLRRDRMERVFKRYGGVFVAIAVLLVAGTAGFNLWRNWQQSQREAATAALVTAVGQAQTAPEKGVEALAAFAAQTSQPDLKAIARFDAAAVKAGTGDKVAAVAIYDSIAADTAVKLVYRDLATLLSVMHQMEKGDPAALQARLQPLMADTSPWRFSAREMTAVLAARAGDKERARTLFQQLADDSAAPAGVRSRAADLAALYGKS